MGKADLKHYRECLKKTTGNICIANIIPLSPTEDPLAYEDAVDKLMKNYRKNATVV